MFIRHGTKNFDDTATRIKKLVAVLDMDWFLRKKKEFKKLCKDGDDYYEFITPSDTQIVDFDIFCFSSSYSKSTTGRDIADKIIATTTAIIDDAGDDKEYRAFKSWIDDTKVWVEEAVNDKIAYNRNEEYTNVMYGIVHKIIWEIDYSFNNKLKILERKYKRNKAVTTTKKVKIIHSYIWLGRQEDLQELYKKMKGTLISSESKLMDIKNVFSGRETATFSPIRWHDSNASELLYFITQLSENGLIKGKRLDYMTLTGCFIRSDGKKFTANFKNLKQSISIKLTSDRMATIDAIVKPFA